MLTSNPEEHLPRIAVQAFDGPLELLLALIAKDEVDVFDIPVARITDEFLAYIRMAEEYDLALAAEFLLMAATLVELKAKALLPRDPDSLEEGEAGVEVSPQDARAMLISALIEYKTYKELAADFERRLEMGERYYARHAPRHEGFTIEKNLLEGIRPEQLRDMVERCVRSIKPTQLSTEHMKDVHFTVEEKIASVRTLLISRKRATFRDIAASATSRLERIVLLLALLEMFKEGLVDLRQAVTFGEIEVVRSGRWAE